LVGREVESLELGGSDGRKAGIELIVRKVKNHNCKRGIRRRRKAGNGSTDLIVGKVKGLEVVKTTDSLRERSSQTVARHVEVGERGCVSEGICDGSADGVGAQVNDLEIHEVAEAAWNGSTEVVVGKFKRGDVVVVIT